MGKYNWLPVATRFLQTVDNYGKNLGVAAVPFQKNFKNDKNFICICEKMGYNKVE